MTRELTLKERAHVSEMGRDPHWRPISETYERNLMEATDNEYKLGFELQRMAASHLSGMVLPLYVDQALAIMRDPSAKQKITELIGSTNSAPQRGFRHKKTGGAYHFVGEARLQSMVAIAEPSHLVVYRALADSSLWVRPYGEFFDGRFEEIE